MISRLLSNADAGKETFKELESLHATANNLTTL